MGGATLLPSAFCFLPSSFVPAERALCHARLLPRKVPSSDLHHRRDRTPDVVVPGGHTAPLAGESFDAGKGFDDRLGPAEVRQAGHDFAVADEEGAVAGSAGHEGGLRLEKAVDVVEACDPDAAFGGADELFARGVAAVDGEMKCRAVLGPA